MYFGKSCLFVLTSVVAYTTAGEPKSDTRADGAKAATVSNDDAPYYTEGILQRNVVSITGTVPRPCMPVEYYYITKDHKMLRKDKDREPIHIADSVDSAVTGWDDSIWYVATNGKIFRLDYSDAEPSEIAGPSGVQLQTVDPNSYTEAYGTSTDGRVYHYIVGAWYKLDSSMGPVSDVSLGNDGALLAYNSSTTKIYNFNWGTQKWDDYGQRGVAADLADAEHVVIVKDTKGTAVKKVGGKWVPLTLKCSNLAVFDQSGFACTSPEGDARFVKY